MKKAKVKKPILKESDMQKTIIDYLNFRGLLNWRNNMGAIMHSVKGEMRYRKNPNKGMPDLFTLYCGLLVGIEVKAKTKQSPEQYSWQQRLEQNGAIYILAHSVEDVAEVLKSLTVGDVG